MSWLCVLSLCCALSQLPFMWTWHDATLTLCTNSIEILMVGSVLFMQMLILLDLALNAALQRMGSRAKWLMAV